MFSKGYLNDYDRCVWEYPLWMVTLVCISDIFLCSMTLILFINPLIKIIKLHDIKDDGFLFVVEKQTILVSFTIISTLLALSCVTFLNGSNSYHAIITILLFPIDVITNVLCSILMFGFHDRLFRMLCCCPSKILHLWVHPLIFDIDEIGVEIASKTDG